MYTSTLKNGPPNTRGFDYDSDKNGDGVPDGQDYDLNKDGRVDSGDYGIISRAKGQVCKVV
jgi:hypothetical protein